MRIEARSLIVRSGNTFAVAGASIEVEPGTILAVVGPNGSGKSSLVKAIAGLVPASGEILFGGRPERPARIGYMPQDIGSKAALTVLEVVLLGRLARLGLRIGKEDLDAVQAVLDELGIGALAPRYIGELSGGQRQLTFLAQALASAPSILLLDEPISALDIRYQFHVLEVVRSLTRARSLATIIVVHDLNAAVRFADRLVLMNRGRLVATGLPADVLTAGTLKDVFAIEATVQPGPDRKPIVVPLRALSTEVHA